MTAEKILKLDNIQYPEDLAWRRESYDAGHPKCLCSACGEHVKDTDIRLWNGEGRKMIEAVLHQSCFEWLHAKGVLHT